IRSVVVVLPASMWAMIPMFRTRSSATAVCVTAKALPFSLPAVVREGLVRLRHPVHVVLLLERPALLLERVEELAGELPRHSLLAPLARELDDPAERERARAALRHLDGHLVVGPADAAGADLEHGRHGLDGLLEHVHRRLAAALADDREGVVDDSLGDAFLAARHDAVDELRHERRAVDRVRDQAARGDLRAPRH